jgi:ABC-2 type transport system permease protein
VLRKTLRDLRWQVFWYGFGLGLLGAFVVYIYPSYREQMANFEVPPALQALIGDADYTSGPGFLSAEFFSWAPVLTVIFGIMAGTSLLAGEEVAGTLELLLARPISRTRLAVEKILGLIAAIVAIAAAIYVGWLLSVPFVEIDVSLTRLAEATANLVPITLMFGLLALWCGVALAERKAATGLVTGVAVVTYFLNYLANLVDVLQPLRILSPFYYYDGTDVLQHGFDLPKLCVVCLLSLVFALLTLGSFQQREIGVHAGLTLPRFGGSARVSADEARG